MLTHKQEKFARLVAEGKDQSTAYKQAYDTAKMKPETITNSAYKLMQNGDLTARIEQFKKEFTKNLDLASQITVERQLKYTQKVIQECLKNGDWNNYLKAMEMQNKLLDLYPTQKSKTDLQFLDKNGQPTEPEKTIIILPSNNRENANN